MYTALTVHATCKDETNRGVKRQYGNSRPLPYKAYLLKGFTQNNYGFQCSLAQIKNRYPLSALFRETSVKTLNEWISCVALTAPTKQKMVEANAAAVVVNLKSASSST